MSRIIRRGLRIVLAVAICAKFAASFEVAAVESVFISEILARNQGGLADEDGDFSEWIELFNSGAEPVNLKGWSLTDTRADPSRWQFPSTNLSAGGFMVVFASGKDRTNAGAALHTNFRLAGEGEYLALVHPDGTTIASEFSPRYPPQFPNVSYGLPFFVTTNRLVPIGAAANAWVPTNATSPAWTRPSFVPAGWISGPTGFGYNTRGSHSRNIATDLLGPMHGLSSSLYLRVPFLVETPAMIESLDLQMRYNDGFVAYLNGQEIARRNAPGKVSWDSVATAAHGRWDVTETLPFEEIEIPGAKGLLQLGLNVLAVQGLNVSSNDDDFLIGPELDAQLLRMDTASLFYFPVPTPGGPNLGGDVEILGQPRFSLRPGVYSSNTLTVEVLAPAPSVVVRYTLDNTTPTATSPIYSAPLLLTNSTLIRARAFRSAFESSDPVTAAYILADPGLSAFDSNLPLLIINTFGTEIPEEARVPASLTFIATGRGRAALLDAPGSQLRARIETKSADSSPKKSFQFALNSDPPIGDDVAVSLFGLPAHADWILSAPYADKTFMNDVLAYELHEAMGHYALRRKYIEVFADHSGQRLTAADYLGIYVLQEKIIIDPNRVNIAKLAPTNNTRPAITGGYLLKKGGLDPDASAIKTVGGAGYSAQTLGIVEPNKTSISAQQKAWINGYLDEFERVLYAPDWLVSRHYADFIDIDSFVDQHWIVEFSKNTDGYRLNNYLSKDRVSKLKMEPIEGWQASFGNSKFFGGSSPADWYYSRIPEEDHLWLRRMLADPWFAQKIVDRWGQLRTNVFAVSNILARIDRLALELNEAQARDFQRWPRLGTYIWPNPAALASINSFAGMTNWIETWIAERFAWIDQQYLPVPRFNSPGGPVQSGFSLALLDSDLPVYYTLDGSDPCLPSGARSPSALLYSGPLIVVNNVRVFARAQNNLGEWSPPCATLLLVKTPTLALTEVMYHPSAPPNANRAYSADDYEYLEIKNVGPRPIQLKNSRLHGAIEFVFSTDLVVPPAGYVLVVRNRTAFASLYGSNHRIAGQYSGSLGTNGQHVRMEGPLGEPIFDSYFDPSWYPITDGAGFSLVVTDETGKGSATTKSAWRPSASPGGSPGAFDPAPPQFPPVYVNELLADTPASVPDAVEVYNASPAPVDLSGWFLTDDLRQPKKFRVPAGTVLPSDQFWLVTGTDFGATNDENIPFDLDAQGGAIYLSSANEARELTGYVHGFRYGGSRLDVAFARYVNTQGEEDFVAELVNTFGDSNSYPLIGPVVISEIHYHPPDVLSHGELWPNTTDEFVELYNSADSPVPFSSSADPLGAWTLGGSVSYVFPTNTTLPPLSFLVVVGFDPAAQPDRLELFRARFGMSESTPVYGPWQGDLKARDGFLSLEIPGPTGPTGRPSRVLLDRVRCFNRFPWDAGADGTGFSLQRLSFTSYGNEPTNWIAAPPTPGGIPNPSSPPLIVSQPRSTSVLAGQNTRFDVLTSASGSWQYQWRFGDENLPNATNRVLELLNVRPGAEGEYRVTIFNGNRIAVSQSATLTVVSPPVIIQSPQPVSVPPGTNVTLVVAAYGQKALSFRWRRNGTVLPGATASTLTITNVQPAQDGLYSVVVSDGQTSLATAPVRLTVLVPPVIIAQPVPQIIAFGANALFSVSLSEAATRPIGYRWRRNGKTVAFQLLDQTTSFLSIRAPIVNGIYTVIVTNAANPIGILSAPASLILLADTDHDGIPDQWELAHGLNPHDPADGSKDSDGDGMSNWAEWISGTNPRDAQSYLRIEIGLAENLARLQFFAVSNKSYSVCAENNLGDSEIKIADVPAQTTNRVITVVDPAPGTHRFYRLKTPSQP